MSTDAFTASSDELDGWARDRDLSGAFLVTRGGETVFEHSCGYADRASGTPVTPGTRFALASFNKMFTAVVVADLVTTGSLTFDTRVVDVLPAERRPSTLLPEVTLHHLLCHTSGIADYFEEDEDYPGYFEDYGALWDDVPSYSIERPLDFLPLFGDLPPYRPPGEQYQYSNAGFILLGLVVEEVTGRPFNDVVQDRVFARAGMDASGSFRMDEPVADVASGYLPRTSPDAPWRTNIYRVPVVGGPDGGAHSTIRDLNRFLHAYADGSLLGDQQEVVLSRHVDAGNGYFCGYAVVHYPDGRYGHAGGDPGVEVVANRWPDDDVNIVALCNMEGLAGDVRDRLIEVARDSGVLSV